MPGFHYSVAVSPFCRCKIALFCKNYVRKFRSVTFVNSKKIRNGSGNGYIRCTETGTAKQQRKNGNGMVETGHKPLNRTDRSQRTFDSLTDITVTCLCSGEEHMKVDVDAVHKRICHLLAVIRTTTEPPPFLSIEKGALLEEQRKSQLLVLLNAADALC